MSQTQIAEQQSTTVQVTDAELLSATPDGEGASSQAAQSGSQIEIGCISRCSASATTGIALSEAAEQAVDQLLQALLGSFPSSSSGLVSGTDQSAVNQTSYQSQRDSGAGAQTQIASESTTTIQYAASSSPATVQSAIGSVESAVAGAVTEVSQTIWQLQIGCLAFCDQTSQVQQAVQLATTIEGIGGADRVDPQGLTALAAKTGQTISQLQIGCLFECEDVTQEQQAIQQYLLVMTSPVSPTPATPSTPNTSPPGQDPVSAEPVGAIPSSTTGGNIDIPGGPAKSHSHRTKKGTPKRRRVAS